MSTWKEFLIYHLNLHMLEEHRFFRTNSEEIIRTRQLLASAYHGRTLLTLWYSEIDWKVMKWAVSESLSAVGISVHSDRSFITSIYKCINQII